MNEKRPLLEVKNLKKIYGPGCSRCTDRENELEKNYCPTCHTVYALKNVSLSIFPGEFVGIVGESGSGKSTLMKSLYFDEVPTDGKYTLANFEDAQVNLFSMTRFRQKWVRNHLLGMVYQNPLLGLYMNFSAQSNIAEKMIAAGNRNVAEMEKISDQMLCEVSIPLIRKKEPPINFSGGMQQRVQIAKALANQPDILLLDEVTTGLDLSVQADVLSLIKKIHQEKENTVLLVSHDLAVIRMLAERTIVMQNGEIVESGLTDQILDDPQHPYTQQLVNSLL